MLKSPRARHRAEAAISACRGLPNAPSLRAAVAELGTFGPGSRGRRLFLPRPDRSPHHRRVARPPPRERDSEAWFQKGLFLEKTGAPAEEAVEAYLQAVEYNPQAAGALVNLGTIRYRLRQFQEAEDYYTRALKADPNYPLAHFNLGNLYDERGDLSKAQLCYETALRINPRYGDAH